MSQSPLPRRIRRLFNTWRSNPTQEESAGPRPNARWGEDPDRVNEARELERVTGVIRNGDALTIVSNDPSYWGARSFELQGTITGVAEAQTLDVTGNFQFRYLTVDMVGSPANTLIIEGDSPSSAVVYFGRAYSPEEQVNDTPAGTVMNQIREERTEYRASGAAERALTLPVYEAGALIAGRYEGRLSLLENEAGKGYLPVSARGDGGSPYQDATVRLDSSGWYLRLVEVGSYSFLLELEPLKLFELTIHHRA